MSAGSFVSGAAPYNGTISVRRHRDIHRRLLLEQERPVIQDSAIDELDIDSLLGLLNQGANAIYVTNVDSGRFVYVSDRACETTGYSRDELIGAHISKVEVNLDRSISWKDFLTEVRKHPRFTIRSKHRHRNGTEFPVEVDVDLIEQDDREYMLAVVNPIEKRENHQDEIIETYSTYFTLFKHSPIALASFDLSEVLEALDVRPGERPSPADSISEDSLRELLLTKSTITDVNVSALELFEAESKDDVIANLDTIMTSTFKDKLVTIFSNILRGNYKQETEMSPRTVSGESLTVLANYMVPPNGRDDLSKVFVSMVNITPRRRAQKKAEQRRRELERSKEKLRQMAENIDEVFYNIAPDYSEAYYISTNYEEIWEQDLEDIYEDPWQFAEPIHENDRGRVLEAKRSFIADNPEGSTLTEYRIVTSGGETKWIRDEMYGVREEGELVSVVGYAKDITEKKQTQQELEESLREKKTLLEEIHHRVKNNMQIVASLLKMQSRKLEGDISKKAFDDSIKRIMAMALIHEKLYQADRLNDLNLESYLRNICEHLLEFHGDAYFETDLTVDVEPIELDLDQTIACGLIVNELVNNSLEHGLKRTGHGRLNVEARRLSSGEYRLTVSDNGTGLDGEIETQQRSTTGFDILEALVEYELEGSFEIDSSGGFSARIQFEI